MWARRLQMQSVFCGTHHRAVFAYYVVCRPERHEHLCELVHLQRGEDLLVAAGLSDSPALPPEIGCGKDDWTSLYSTARPGWTGAVARVRFLSNSAIAISGPIFPLPNSLLWRCCCCRVRNCIVGWTAPVSLYSTFCSWTQPHKRAWASHRTWKHNAFEASPALFTQTAPPFRMYKRLQVQMVAASSVCKRVKLRRRGRAVSCAAVLQPRSSAQQTTLSHAAGETLCDPGGACAGRLPDASYGAADKTAFLGFPTRASLAASTRRNRRRMRRTFR
ncbi:hypothetical protein ABL78_2073 [Leptomonas seymouri]|uniref:Uncharacterized protein n=1 Tax=Leptomonas seymouri TaxID=5684 RepID=A0A0N1I9Q3_LEPSE|nr:hypothetical protein ABL78_2073 [Leptomonas seymouri]|eukprot:KPI88814.1 hypothetical protein ABL78_2073 [Leptomonas seymouri]